MSKGARRFALPGVLAWGGAVAASLLCLPAPYAWLCGSLAAALFSVCLIVLLRSPGLRNLLLFVCVLCLGLAGAEAYFGLTRPDLSAVKSPSAPSPAELRRNATQPAAQAREAAPTVAEAAPEQASGERFLTPSELVHFSYPGLGYRPKVMASKTRHRQEVNGTLLYDVVYTTLPSGWRVTPQHPGAKTAVVLFGCSFTWGDGLEDGDTFPWKLGELLGDGYQVFNFAFSGYGSQHLLAQLESGLLDDITSRYDKVYVFYTTMEHHPERSAGYSTWDPNGPWYGFSGGRIVRKGVFADARPAWLDWTDVLFGKSLSYLAVKQIKFMPKSMRIRLHAGIIKEADRQLAERYGLHLTVALWPFTPFRQELADEGLELLDLRPFFPPDLEQRQNEFRLHPTDWHPNARATGVVAEALAGYIRQHR